MLNLRIQQIQYEFTAAKPLQLHYDIPTITLRGAFGYALAHVIAVKSNIPELEPQVELYKSIFCPQNAGDKDSRNHEIARPFIIRGAYNSSDKKIFNLRIGENICDVLESLSAKSYFSDEIKHLIITRYNDYDKRRGYKKPRYWDLSIPREAYVIYIKVDNLIITEIRLYNFMNEDGKLFYSQYII